VTLTPSNGWAGSGITDNNGTTSGKVPKDEAFTLEVLDQCGNAIYTLPVGPFAADVDLGNIVVPNSTLNTTTLTGQLVDCNNLPIVNGLAIIQYDGQTIYEYTTTGSFDVSFSTCSTSGDATVTAVDLDALLQSNPITAPAGSATNLGQISVCGAQLENFIRVTVDGVTAVYTVALITQDSFSGTVLTYANSSNNISTAIYFAGQNVGSYGGPTGNSLYALYDLQNGWEMQSASFDNFEITEYGANIGDKIIGNFSGNLVNNATQPPQNVTVSGDFSINRDF
jgi:hypothetical protein